LEENAMPEDHDCSDLLDQSNSNNLTISFQEHIAPLFSDEQVECMRNDNFRTGNHASDEGPVLLINYEWMSDPAPSDDGDYADHSNARNVLAHLKGADRGGQNPVMPPADPWPDSCVNLFEKWIKDGCKP
jgi:hypothetical protein